GKAGSLSRDGFVFDTGPSLLTLPEVFEELFASTGGPLADLVELQPLDPETCYHWPDGSAVTLPGGGPDAVAQAFGDAFGGSAASDWHALMSRAAQVWTLTRGPVLESPISGPGDLLKLVHSLRDVKTIDPFRTLRQVGTRTLSDPRLVMILDRYATYTGSDPRKAPAALVTVPYVEQQFGAWHVRGGIHRLAAALWQRCQHLGVQIMLNSDVTGVSIAGGRASGLELSDGSVFQADVVVSNADATHLYRDLVTPPAARAPLRRLGRVTPSFSGFVIMLAVRGRTPGLAHHNLWFPPDYDQEFDAVFSGRPVVEPAIYACVPDDPLMRPDADHESWFILVNAPRHGDTEEPGASTFDWDRPGVSAQYADSIVDQLANRGIDLRPRILWREIITPADLARRTRSPGGSIYGTSSNGSRAAFLRPANSSPIKGLFLVGGSAHPGGGLPLVAISARIVADQIGRP
ncbi:MAG: phytoene desaturase family protein, partial [Actinomycetes bacterium]